MSGTTSQPPPAGGSAHATCHEQVCVKSKIYERHAWTREKSPHTDENKHGACTALCFLHSYKNAWKSYRIGDSKEVDRCRSAARRIDAQLDKRRGDISVEQRDMRRTYRAVVAVGWMPDQQTRQAKEVSWASKQLRERVCVKENKRASCRVAFERTSHCRQPLRQRELKRR